ncbi:MAG: oligosaccharide flippase family protein [Nanoarchaeota archaeon]
MGFFKEGESDIQTVFTRITRRDFSGNTGLAIKNSAYQFSTNLAGKLGSLVFVIILARIILPETFGLYNLVFSTTMFFYVFSDLGANQAIIYFSSGTLHRDKAKAKAYINYLFKIKFALSLMSSIVLMALAKIISDSYYNQPIFLALIAGSLFLFFTGMQSFYLSISQSNNNFRNPLIKEVFFQVSRIILIPVILLYISSLELSSSSLVLAIFLILGAISVLSMSLILFLSSRDIGLNSIKAARLNSKEKRRIKKFIVKIALITSSVLLLGNIDKIIIGPFVPPEFVGYYSAAFSLVNASAFLIVFSDVFFPLFLRMKGSRLKRAFGKSVQATFILSFLLFIFLLIFATPLIGFIFGGNYMPSVSMLRVLALLAVFFPLIEIYTSYIISKGNLEKITKVILSIVILSVALPLLFVRLFLNYGHTSAVFGLILGLLVSKAIHLTCLIFISRKI